MAWATSLLPAKYGGIEFNIIKTDDTADRALVEHAYPFVDGADVEDMGRGARKISVEAVFYGDTYELELNNFLGAVDLPYPPTAGLVLQHPVFGEINVKVASYAVHHDADSVDQASVTVTFVETKPGNSFFNDKQVAKNINAMNACSTLAKAATTSKYAAIIAKIQAANPMAGLNKLRQAITGPILAAMSFANEVLANLDVLAYPQSWANDFQTLIQGALSIRGWGANLVQEWASIKATFSLLSVFSTSSANPPAAVDTNAATPPSQDQAVAVTQATVGVFIATALADAVALAFGALADAQNAASATVTSGTSAPATSGAPLLAPDAIEEMSNSARTAIEAAIEQARSVYSLEDSRAITEPLRDLALAIQSTAAALIEARPPLVQRTINAPGNMRLVAHQLYGDQSRAPELWLLNGARSPFVDVGDVINAYAT